MLRGCSLLLSALLVISASPAEDWPRFLGPAGAARSADANVPLTWSDQENLAWKTELPGAGSSSPIVQGQRVYVCCFSGVASGQEDPAKLMRHLVAIDRRDGKIAWQRSVDAQQPEDRYGGFITEHGYASNTPVTDGRRIFAFFGKSGVLAFDLDGKELWRTPVGQESSSRRWGSGSSLTLYKNLLIVNAAEESQALIALDQETGKEVWREEAASLELAYGTPALATLPDGQAQLVLGVPGEVWGLNPENGDLMWFAKAGLNGNVSPSPVIDGDMVYAFGGRPAASLAVRLGGKDDVSSSHVAWSTRSGSYVATPLVHDGHLYWVDDRGMAWCIRASNGEKVYSERLPDLRGGGRPVYASPVLIGDKLLVVSRWNGAFVLPAEPRFEVLGNPQLTDDTDFNATPAISDGRLLIRSDRALYCIAKP